LEGQAYYLLIITKCGTNVKAARIVLCRQAEALFVGKVLRIIPHLHVRRDFLKALDPATGKESSKYV